MHAMAPGRSAARQRRPGRIVWHAAASARNRQEALRSCPRDLCEGNGQASPPAQAGAWRRVSPHRPSGIGAAAKATWTRPARGAERPFREYVIRHRDFRRIAHLAAFPFASPKPPRQGKHVLASTGKEVQADEGKCNPPLVPKDGDHRRCWVGGSAGWWTGLDSN